MSKRYGRAGLGLAAAAAIVLALFVPWGGTRIGQATAAEIIGQAIDALSGLESVYIKLNIRTSPHDNFDSIKLDAPGPEEAASAS